MFSRFVHGAIRKERFVLFEGNGEEMTSIKVWSADFGWGWRKFVNHGYEDDYPESDDSEVKK